MSRVATRSYAALQRRARHAGLQPSYIDANDEPRSSSSEAIEAALAVLDAAREARDDQPGPTVLVVRGRTRAPLALGPAWEGHPVWHRDETGERRRLEVDGHVRTSSTGAILDLGSFELEVGYHELTVERPGGSDTYLVLAAPSRLPRQGPTAGLFQPIYGIRADDDHGTGTYRSFGELARIAGSLGFGFVGTTPCYATFLERHFDPSPYLPVSRVAWNELFLDVGAVPELDSNEPARELLNSPEVRGEIERLRSRTRVDYQGAARLQRRLLALLAARMLESRGARRRSFDAFLRTHPEIVDYAKFRDRDEFPVTGGTTPVTGYHEYVQFLCHEQLRGISSAAGDVGLYLDFPVGVNPAGFDVARWPGCFLTGAAAGAPPDTFFVKGQTWGFHPLDPAGLRADGYRYLITCYRRAFEYATALRIDHVMGLERMWLVPEGCSAADGVYLTYPDEELRAVALIEATRAGATLVGEDLGTVPRSTELHLKRDGLLHSAVYRFEAGPDEPIPTPRRESMVSFATHDMARFGAFMTGSDLDQELADAGRPEELETAHLERDRWVTALRSALGLRAEALTSDVYLELMRRLAEHHPRALLVDLGDCLGDPERENLPGTIDFERNWTHRCSATLSELESDTGLLARLQAVTATATGARR